MINLSEAASAEIQRLAREGGFTDAMVRFGVVTGGCSGMQYSMDFEHEAGQKDHVFSHGSLKVVCDAESLAFLDGLEVDFSDKLIGGGFRFHNPNAQGSCGCGTSFRV
jgi:iron-sulfur cluster assembly protein